MTEEALGHSKSIPMASLRQVVPSRVCLSCDVCCRFPEQDSVLRPYFTADEIRQAIKRGIDSSHFPDLTGCQVRVVPTPSGQGYLCPAFDPSTSYCLVYEVRPLDCQIYPFVVMWNQDQHKVLLGWDTKCPFLVDQSLSETIHQLEPLAISPDSALPQDTLNFARHLADRLQTEEMAAIFASNQQLVMRFQVDVMVIQELPALTHRLLSPEG